MYRITMDVATSVMEKNALGAWMQAHLVEWKT